jgi:hypothetical protein
MLDCFRRIALREQFNFIDPARGLDHGGSAKTETRVRRARFAHPLALPYPRSGS